MTVVRTTVQICDVGGETRNLAQNEGPDRGGWRELTQGRHICPTCIDLVCDPSFALTLSHLKSIDNTSDVG